MKITHKTFGSTVTEFDGVREAVEHSLTPDAYSYEGQLEKLASENEKLREVLSRLVECIYGEQKTKHEALQYILGHGYKVEE